MDKLINRIRTSTNEKGNMMMLVILFILLSSATVITLVATYSFTSKEEAKSIIAEQHRTHLNESSLITATELSDYYSLHGEFPLTLTPLSAHDGTEITRVPSLSSDGSLLVSFLNGDEPLGEETYTPPAADDNEITEDYVVVGFTADGSAIWRKTD